MKIIYCLLIIIFSTSTLASEIQQHKFKSKTLGRDYKFTVYFPDAYQDELKNFPVLYLLHGSVGSENDWVKRGHIQATSDNLVIKEKIPPMIIVMPGHSRSWWADGNDEAAETVLLKELFPYVEKNFRVNKNRDGRAVAGLSAGGFGTVNLTLRYPELFAAGAALSPAVYKDVPPETSSAYRHKVFQVDGKLDPDTWRELNWPSFVDQYMAKGTIVPLYINSGDHDRLDIAYHAAYFYQYLRNHQPKDIEFRVVDGDHEWDVWAGTIGDGLQFIGKYLKAPEK
jgi:enterochelin esterase-like enzyme